MATPYADYLHLDRLLDCQHPESAANGVAAHDEHLFIVIHQAYELWFKQLLHELDPIRAALVEGRGLPALKAFKRVHAIQKVLVQQVDVLETMTPVDFNDFRRLLRTASGFQSLQFREIEALAGGGIPETLNRYAKVVGAEKLRTRLAQGTLYEAFLTYLWRHGHPVPEALLAAGATRQPRTSDPAVLAIVKDIYEQSGVSPAAYEAYLLAEHLLEFEELLLFFRTRHMRMAERTIGRKYGTAGSDGVAFLQSTLEQKIFPELWEVRSLLGA
jgi:tryptophan 2,3-dioxygenase